MSFFIAFRKEYNDNMMSQKMTENKQMTKMCFAEQVASGLKNAIGGNSEVLIQNVRKNNGVVLTGVSIFSKDRNMSPTIYLEGSYEQYLEGEDMEEIVKELHACYTENCPENAFDTDFFIDYELVRERIAYRLVNREKNADFLKEVPFIPYLDMAIIFFCKIEHEELGSGMIQIRNEHMRLWGAEKERLFYDAERNMRRLCPELICTMQELLESAGDEQEIPEDMLREAGESGKLQMLVITNSGKSYGAAVILYEGVLDGLSERMQSSLAILPSSVHEMIVLPVKNEEEAAAFCGMVREINETQVETEEVLTDSVYFYDKHMHVLTISNKKIDECVPKAL